MASRTIASGITRDMLKDANMLSAQTVSYPTLGLFSLALVSAGPLATVGMVARMAQVGMLPAEWLMPVGLTLLGALWSPLFMSIPALLMQDFRDDVKRGGVFGSRWLKVMRALSANGSPYRLAHHLSLAGLGLAVAVLYRVAFV